MSSAITTNVDYFWFIGNATREQAERFVETHGAGTFVARYKQDDQERQIVLTWQSNMAMRIVHLVVALKNDIGWHVVSDARRSYASLHALICDQPEVLVDERAVATPSDYDDLSRLVAESRARMIVPATTSAATTVTRIYDTTMNVTSNQADTAAAAADDCLAPLPFSPHLPLSRSADAFVVRENDVQLCEQLGEGAFGVVYRGIWQHDVVAVKMLKVAPLGSGDSARLPAKRAKLIGDFCAEIRRMAAIPAHENVLLLYGQTTFARQPDVVAAIVEYCEGGSLASLVYNPQCALPLADQLSIAAKAASGVLHLHRNSIVHRDIAARNVLLKSKRAPYGVKVADFGLSRQIDPNASEQRSSSPQPLEWMAPESFGGIYSKFSDSYMFGMLLYEIFERKRPWGDADRGIDGIRALVVGERERPPVRAAPPDVAQLMQQCWHATPHARIGIAEIKRQIESHREAMPLAPLSLPVAPAAPYRATNEFRNQLWGACACGDCDEYYRPVEGAKCDFCGCVVLQHTKLPLETQAASSLSPPIVLAPYVEPQTTSP